MATIEEHSKESMRLHLDESFMTFNKEHNSMREWQFGYCQGATEQREIDIANCVKWCERFNIDALRTGSNQFIDVESFKSWITNIITNYGND